MNQLICHNTIITANQPNINKQTNNQAIQPISSKYNTHKRSITIANHKQVNQKTRTTNKEPKKTNHHKRTHPTQTQNQSTKTNKLQ